MWGQAPELGFEMVTFLTFLARYGIGGGASPRRRMPKGALMSGFETPPRGRRLCPRRRAVDRAGSDFLSKNRLQHVALEIAGAAEELFFAFCEANSRLPFLLNERNETHEVRDLKEPVSPRPHVLREFPVVAVARRHGFVDEVRYDGLAAIVIHFYLEVRNSMEIRGVEEFGNAHLELGDDLFLGGYEFLVDADASIAKWRFPGESHHRGKYTVAHFPSHVFVAVLSPDKRSGMKAKVWQPHPGKCFVKFADGFVYALLLIMSDKRHDVKPRVGTGKWKVAGFVNEYAQSRVVGHGCKARAAGCPPLKAKNFLRVSVTPAFRPSSVRILPNSAAWRKGGAARNLPQQPCGHE